MLNFLKKMFIPDDATSTQEAAGKAGSSPKPVAPMTRQELSDFIFQHFVEQLKFESTREGLLFPTAFTVLMHQADYDCHRSSLGFTVKELNGRLVKCVRECIKRYPDYELHAYSWVFRFIPLEDDAELPPELGSERPQLGNPMILMQLYSEEALNDDQLSGRVVGTLKNKNSLQVIPTGLNIRALGPVDRRSEGKFIVKIEGLSDNEPSKPKAPSIDNNTKPSMQDGQSHTSNDANPNAKSKVMFKAEDGSFIDRFGGRTHNIILDNISVDIELHGRDSSITPKNGAAVVRIDSQEVFNPHIIIHLNGDGTFSFTPLGNVMVNETAYRRDLSARYPLYHNSTVMIDGAIQFKFLDTAHP